MYKPYWNQWKESKNLLFFEEVGGGGGGKSAEDIIKDAADKAKGEPPKKEEPKKEDEPTEDEIKELEQAKNLLKVLKDPDARKAFINSLAEKEGITKDSTVKEKEKAVESITSIITEEFGEDYPELSKKLEKILTKAFDLHTKKEVNPIREGLTAKETAAIEKSASEAYDKVFAEYKEAKTLETEVAKLCAEIKPGKQSPEAYFRRLLTIAADEKGIKLTKISAKDTITKEFNKDRRELNKNDASSRIASEGVDDTNVSKTSKPMSLDEAIAAGAKVAEEKLKK